MADKWRLLCLLSSLIEPCPGCHAPYGFQNVMSLSKDTDRFAVSYTSWETSNSPQHK